jgi:hypothetical protein
MSPIQRGLEAEDTREPRAERPIVVGIDGSPGAVAALRWAAVEARTHGRRLTPSTPTTRWCTAPHAADGRDLGPGDGRWRSPA